MPILLALFALFFVLSFAIRTQGTANLDLSVTTKLQSLRSPFADAIARTFTFLGNGLTLTILASAIAIYALVRRRFIFSLFVALSLLGLVLNPLLKHWAHRPRPTADAVSIIMPALGLSFPSGHAMASSAFYGFLAYAAYVHIHRPLAYWCSAALAFIALMVGLSRIYLGVHWFSDVVGGFTAGILLVTILSLFYSPDKKIGANKE